ncbi:hypothetical protein EYA84_20050 [Verrucosispora sp. SN26_14.1]|uniref:hypothetical protein n=1 Tax=Verrucosispora sp. SN26_14.1 TaxID=2527879 RepID=UPI0010354314|nr:hypothetical protein [Verrucosispora sp. SN26_14.1]TBL32020.1 hypothetical protein EYA84_20050 [Verrucosispora sp. SN26_14.1]
MTLPTREPDRASADTDPRIVLVAGDDTFCHVYRNLAELLDEQRHYDKLDGPVEFFDPTGRQLIPAFSQDWQLVELHPSHRPAAPEILRERFKAVLAHVEQFVRERPQVLGDHRIDVEEVLSDLPDCDAPNFTDVVDALPWHSHGHRGNLLHNAMHAAGWAR